MIHLLSADLIAKYLHLLGETVISVSGSDAHGTPIVLAANKEGLGPSEFVTDKHEYFVKILKTWNIELDHYTVTTTRQHAEFVQEFYAIIKENGYIIELENLQYYCTSCSHFLPDRFILGICPYCNTNNGRGDQCANDGCSRPLTPFEIINPICSQCYLTPNKQLTRHAYFKLDELSEILLNFLKTVNIPDTFRKEAIAFILRGLTKRAVTRDLNWGIDASNIIASDQRKVYYVWAEDVLGYVSASIPVLTALEFDWKSIWKKVNTVYCIGKDNLFYHGIWLPALLYANSTEYSLPHTLAITHFLQFEGKAFSKSKGIGVWADQAAELAPIDYWRFYLIHTRPENRDTNFTWSHFEEVINKELIYTIANTVRRFVSVVNNFNDSSVTPCIIQAGENITFLEQIRNIELLLITEVYHFKLKSALELTIKIAYRTNLHLEEIRPWNVEDDLFRSEVLYCCLLSLQRLSLWLYPVVPTIAKEIKDLLNVTETELCDWDVLLSKKETIKINGSFFLEKFTLNQSR